MPFELWRKCADEVAARSPTTQVWFSFCGEPLLEPERLFEYLAYGRSVGLQALCMNTNGMLLTPELAGRVLDAGLSQLVFGIDGFSAETYAKFRCGGDRDTVFANVEHLLELRRREGRGAETDVMVQFIVMDGNEHEKETFREYWLERGATVKVRNPLSWGGSVSTGTRVVPEDRIPCPWAVTMLHVFWDGRVPRCPGDTEGEEGVGNAWHDSLENLWGRLGTYRERHLAHRFDELPDRCHQCTDWMVGIADRIRGSSSPAPE
jgi:uncharacterized radical SAM superfamily Fe-S cluster-containing enzyme